VLIISALQFTAHAFPLDNISLTSTQKAIYITMNQKHPESYLLFILKKGTEGNIHNHQPETPFHIPFHINLPTVIPITNTTIRYSGNGRKFLWVCTGSLSSVVAGV
jgi:hypothetical protein